MIIFIRSPHSNTKEDSFVFILSNHPEVWKGSTSYRILITLNQLHNAARACNWERTNFNEKGTDTKRKANSVINCNVDVKSFFIIPDL